LIVVEASDKNYEKVLGHRLEIVPTTDPTTARIGDELVFRILFDGKPLQTNVFATYDGFSRYYNTYAYAHQITDPAAWLVRVERRMAVAEKDYDFQMFKATWFFPCDSAGLKFGFGPVRVRS
jgi:Domain of unknown function (DUF4198)